MVETLDVDGSMIRVHRQGAAGRTIIYLHSGAGEVCTLPFFDELTRGFAEVIVPELPGFGGSSPPKERWRSIEDAVFHVIRAIELLYPEGKYTLVGSSLGGWLAAEVAIWRPDRVEALVLIGAVGLRLAHSPTYNIFGNPDEVDHEAELNRRANPHSVDTLTPILGALADKDIPQQQAILLHFLRSGAVLAKLGWNPLLADVRLQGRLGSIALPTLILWGADDGIVTVEHGKAFEAAIPRAELVVLEQVGHTPVLEKPKEAAATIRAFLSKK